MKVLLLTYPYQCVHQFGKHLADCIDHNFIEDPMDISLPTKYTRYYDDLKTEITRSRDYIFPNEVPDNTIISHNVDWHKLPGNRTEEQFLNDWTGSFDKVIAITTTNLTSSTKNYIASDYFVEKNNGYWKKWARENGGHLREKLQDYELSEYWDNDKLNDLESSHNFLITYSLDNNITSSISDEFIHHSASFEDVNAVINSWDLPGWNSITNSSLLSGSYGHPQLMSHCSSWEKRTY